MVQLRHTGLYVMGLDAMEEFYKKVFGMHAICSHQIQDDLLIQDIIGDSYAKVCITKLITDQGKTSHVDDMLELVQVISPEDKADRVDYRHIFSPGTMHLAFGVDDIEEIVNLVEENGGNIYGMSRKVRNMPNGKKCVFCQDPEKNYIELIGKC